MILEKTNKKCFSQTLQILSNEGVIILPCDTVYGFSGVLGKTEEKIRSIKGRGETKPFIQLLDSRERFFSYSCQEVPEDLLNLWPGPLTLITATKTGIITAFRIPDDPFIQKLVNSLDSPIYSTSVNRSGEPVLWQLTAIIHEFESSVDLIVSDGDLPGRLPSTILNITTKPFTLVREGACKIPPQFLM